MKAFKIVEVLDGKIKTLFHGLNKSKTMEQGKWLEADVKLGRDGSGNRYYLTGWHTLLTLEEAKEYLSRFKSRIASLKIVECEITEIWKKQHSPSNVMLSRYIKFGEILDV